MRCGGIVTSDERPERCPECQSGRDAFALWTTNDDFARYPEDDWSRQVWWKSGTGFRAGKIRG